MIEIQNLTKRFGSATAVDQLSFQVPEGRVTGFLGPNGAGKSTTMRVIVGLDTPTSGTATINGELYRCLRHPLRQAGSLLDASAMHGGLTAYRQMLWIAASNQIPARRVAEVLEQVGLAAVAHKRIRTYSLGMRQRLGIAAALLGDPPVLIFDEPVNGLDPQGIAWIRELMRGYAAQGRTVLVSSHLMSELALTADHLVVIVKGKLVADTPITEFLQASELGDVRVRTPESATLAAIVTAHGAVVRHEPDGALSVTGLPPERISMLAAQNTIPIFEIARREASLEQAYLKLTEGPSK